MQTLQRFGFQTFEEYLSEPISVFSAVNPKGSKNVSSTKHNVYHPITLTRFYTWPGFSCQQILADFGTRILHLPVLADPIWSNPVERTPSQLSTESELVEGVGNIRKSINGALLWISLPPCVILLSRVVVLPVIDDLDLNQTYMISRILYHSTSVSSTLLLPLVRSIIDSVSPHVLNQPNAPQPVTATERELRCPNITAFLIHHYSLIIHRNSNILTAEEHEQLEGQFPHPYSHPDPVEVLLMISAIKSMSSNRRQFRYVLAGLAEPEDQIDFHRLQYPLVAMTQLFLVMAPLIPPEVMIHFMCIYSTQYERPGVSIMGIYVDAFRQNRLRAEIQRYDARFIDDLGLTAGSNDSSLTILHRIVANLPPAYPYLLPGHSTLQGLSEVVVWRNGFTLPNNQLRPDYACVPVRGESINRAPGDLKLAKNLSIARIWRGDPPLSILWPISQVYCYANLHQSRYCFIITEKDFIAMERQAKEDNHLEPRNGHVRIAQPVLFTKHRTPSTQTHYDLTPRMAMVYFILLVAIDSRYELVTTMWNKPANTFVFKSALLEHLQNAKADKIQLKLLDPGEAPWLDL